MAARSKSRTTSRIRATTSGPVHAAVSAPLVKRANQAGHIMPNNADPIEPNARNFAALRRNSIGPNRISWRSHEIFIGSRDYSIMDVALDARALVH
jgi:hypothetical protein